MLLQRVLRSRLRARPFKPERPASGVARRRATGPGPNRAKRPAAREEPHFPNAGTGSARAASVAEQYSAHAVLGTALARAPLTVYGGTSPGALLRSLRGLRVLVEDVEHARVTRELRRDTARRGSAVLAENAIRALVELLQVPLASDVAADVVDAGHQLHADTWASLIAQSESFGVAAVERVVALMERSGQPHTAATYAAALRVHAHQGDADAVMWLVADMPAEVREDTRGAVAANAVRACAPRSNPRSVLRAVADARSHGAPLHAFAGAAIEALHSATRSAGSGADAAALRRCTCDLLRDALLEGVPLPTRTLISGLMAARKTGRQAEVLPPLAAQVQSRAQPVDADLVNVAVLAALDVGNSLVPPLLLAAVRSAGLEPLEETANLTATLLARRRKWAPLLALVDDMEARGARVGGVLRNNAVVAAAMAGEGKKAAAAWQALSRSEHAPWPDAQAVAAVTLARQGRAGPLIPLLARAVADRAVDEATLARCVLALQQENVQSMFRDVGPSRGASPGHVLTHLLEFCGDRGITIPAAVLARLAASQLAGAQALAAGVVSTRNAGGDGRAGEWQRQRSAVRALAQVVAAAGGGNKAEEGEDRSRCGAALVRLAALMGDAETARAGGACVADAEHAAALAAGGSQEVHDAAVEAATAAAAAASKLSEGEGEDDGGGGGEVDEVDEGDFGEEVPVVDEEGDEE